MGLGSDAIDSSNADLQIPPAATQPGKNVVSLSSGDPGSAAHHSIRSVVAFSSDLFEQALASRNSPHQAVIRTVKRIRIDVHLVQPM
jgi:hypothetical protein